MRRIPRAAEAGFTLIELVIVVSIAAAVFLILVQGVRQASDAFALRRATSIVVAEMRTAQAAAMSAGADVTLELYTSTGSGSAGGVKMWAGGASARSVLPPEWPKQIQLRDEQTTLPNCTAPANTSHRCVTFRPLGYPVASGRARLRAFGSGSSLDVVVDPATGRVSVQR